MIYEIIKLVLLVVIILSITISLISFLITYRKYYVYMKNNYHNEWLELMNKDPFIEATGEWIRWPSGSIYLILSILKKGKIGDDELNKYKLKACKAFIIYAIAMILFFIIIAVLAINK